MEWKQPCSRYLTAATMASPSSSALPFQVPSHDSMRLGLPAFKEDAAMKHPVEVVQAESRKEVRVLPEGCPGMRQS